MKSNQIIVLVSHITASKGSAQALEEYLQQQKATFGVIFHPLYGFEIKQSIWRYYQEGKLVQEKKIDRKNQSSTVTFITDLWLTIKILKIHSPKNVGLMICLNPLNALAGLILRKLGKTKKTILYSVDYANKRFNNILLNLIYHLLDSFAAKHSDYCWSITQPIREIRRKMGVKEQKNILVPNGLDTTSLPKTPNIAQKNLFYIGHLTQTKGVQDLIDIMPLIVNRISDVKLHIIGGGPYQKILEEKVIKSPYKKNIIFYGYTQLAQTYKILSLGGIGLAPYQNLDDFVKFSDPLKVKNYLAMGLPVIITKIPIIAQVIEHKKMGFAVTCKEDIIRAIAELLSNQKVFLEFRKNALNYKNTCDINKIYDQAFKLVL